MADIQGDGLGDDLSSNPALVAINQTGNHEVYTTLLAGVMSAQNDICSQNNTGCAAAILLRNACSGEFLGDHLANAQWRAIFGQDNDALVPLTSQLIGGIGSASFNGLIHTSGLTSIGFVGPSELEDLNGIQPAVISLLNAVLSSSQFHRLP